MDTFNYIYQSDYGSPEVDQTTPTITAALVSADKKSVHLKVNGLVRGSIHHLVAKGVRSATAQELWHPEAWYTLNDIPD